MDPFGDVEDADILSFENAVKNAQHLVGIDSPIADGPASAMRILNDL